MPLEKPKYVIKLSQFLIELTLRVSVFFHS